MKKGRIVFAAVVIALFFFALSCGTAAYIACTGAYVEEAGRTLSAKASESLGVPVAIDAVRVESWHTLALDGIAVQDRAGEEILHAAHAEVEMSLFAALSASPVAAISHVTVIEPELSLQQREDGSWNVADLVQQEAGENDFCGKVSVKEGKANVAVSGKEIALEDIGAELDFAHKSSVSVEAEASCKGAPLAVEGEVSKERQELKLKGENINAMDYIAFLPEGVLPDEIEPQALHVDEAALKLVREADDVSLAGDVRLSGAKALVHGMEVEASRGLVVFSGKEARIFLRASAEEQQASIHGKVAWQEEVPSFNFVVESAAFDPSKILAQSPFQGSVRVLASVYGTPQDWKIDGECEASAATLYGTSLSAVKAKGHYEDGLLTASGEAGALGGTFEGGGMLRTADGSYSAHVEAKGLSGEEIAAVLPVDGLSLTGKCAADIALSGKGTDLADLLAYGTFSGEGASFGGVAAEKVSASFFKQGELLHFDNLNASFAAGGTLVVEGDVRGGTALDLRFYGTALPLALVDAFVPEAEGAGTLDIAGAVRGDASNPRIEADFEGTAGSLFHQPFDAFHGAVHGSADGIAIDRFSVERAGKETWIAEGSVGLTGERRIDLRVDSIGARMEDIAALVAPDQPITGNVDNTIRFTGTLDNPSAVGYIHLYRGSYNGYILSGMDGDYYLENGVVRLQDFHIFSPLVDVDLNGTVTRDGALDLYADVHDVSLDRFGSRLPYPVSGHGTFAGHIAGTLQSPEFIGVLDAKTLQLNGQAIESVHGEIVYGADVLRAENIRFQQNGGAYAMKCTANLETQALDGILNVENGDVRALFAIANLKNDILDGRLNGTIRLGGTLDNPMAALDAVVVEGKAAGYEIRDMALNVKLADHVVTIDELHGRQGDGVFAAKGRIPLDGAVMDAQFAANGIPAGMVAKAAGADADVSGTIDLAVQFGGTLKNPQANASVEVKNGGVGASTFDDMTGLASLKDSVINIEQLRVKKKLGERDYSASAKGKIPVRSLTAAADETVASSEQIDLSLALDDADLSLLPILSPAVEWAIGPTKGKVRVTGTLERPQFAGEVSLADGALKFKDVATPVTEMKARLRFFGSSITLEDCTGKMGTGSYRIAGRTSFVGGRWRDYALDFKADELSVVSSFYDGPLTAVFHLEEGEMFGQKMPKLTGDIRIHHATLSIPSLPDAESTLPEMILDVGVTLGERVRFYDPALYDMRLSGAFRYGGTTQHVEPSGTILVERGTITYNKTRFTIRDGEAYFNQIGSFLPSLTLEAEAHVGKVRIFLHSKGPIGAMETHLSSMPEMSETEIVSLLTFQTPDLKSSQALTSLLTFGLSMTVLGEFETNVKNALGLDEFRIAGEDVTTTDKDVMKPGETAHGLEYTLEVGKYINDRVMLRYKQGIGNKVREFGVRYDFNDRMSIYWNRNEDSQSVIGIEARIKF